MNLQRENLKFGYSFIIIIKVIAYLCLLIGGVFSLILVGAGIYNGIKAKYANEEAKVKINETLNANLKKEDENLLTIRTTQTEAQKQAKLTCEQNTVALQAKFNADKENYKTACNNFNSALTSKLESLTALSEEAIADLARMDGGDKSSLSKITILNPGINTPENAQEFSESLSSANATIETYKAYIKGSIEEEYNKLIAPVNEEIEKITKAIESIQARKGAIVERLNEIAAAHAPTSETAYEAVSVPGEKKVRPIPNIYGITDPEMLEDIDTTRNSLPIISFEIPNDEPIAEESVQKLRIALVRIQKWLPRIQKEPDTTQEIPYQKTVPGAPYTEDDEFEIETLRDESYELESKLATLTGKKNQLTQLKEAVESSHNEVISQLHQICNNWAVYDALASIKQMLSMYDTRPPASIDSKLKELINIRDATIANAKNAIAEAEAQTENNKQSLKKQATTDIVALSNEERVLSTTVITAALVTGGCVLGGSWVTFYLLLVIANFMACPLIIALRALNKLPEDQE